MTNNVLTHATHCCRLHGCKYGENKTCPVKQREVEQEYLCELCPGGLAEADADVEEAKRTRKHVRRVLAYQRSKREAKS